MNNTLTSTDINRKTMGRFLKGLDILTYALAAEMILLAEKAKTKEEALKMARESVSSGKALEKFLH